MGMFDHILLSDEKAPNKKPSVKPNTGTTGLFDHILSGPIPDEDLKSNVISDLGHQFTSAANTGLASTARFVDTIAGDGKDGEFIKRLEDNAAYGQEKLSPRQKRANQKRFFSDKEGEIFGEAWKDPRTYSALGAEALGSFVPMALTGGPASGALKAAALKIGAIQGGKAAAIAGGLGYGLSETAMVTGGVAGDIQKHVNNMPSEVLSTAPRYQELYQANLKNGLDEKQAALNARGDLGRELGVKGMKNVALPSLLLGSYAGKFLDASLAGKLTGSRGKNFLKGLAIEGLTEGGQGGSEQLVKNVVLGDVDPSIKLTDDVLESVAREGIGGGFVGGGIGAISSPNIDATGRDIDQSGKRIKDEKTGSDLSQESIDVGNEALKKAQKKKTKAKKTSSKTEPAAKQTLESYNVSTDGAEGTTTPQKAYLNQAGLNKDLVSLRRSIKDSGDQDGSKTAQAKQVQAEFNRVTTGLNDWQANSKDSKAHRKQTANFKKTLQKGDTVIHPEHGKVMVSNVGRASVGIKKGKGDNAVDLGSVPYESLSPKGQVNEETIQQTTEKAAKTDNRGADQTTEINVDGVTEETGGDSKKANKNGKPDVSGTNGENGSSDTERLSGGDFKGTHTTSNGDVVRKIGENLYIEEDGTEVEDDYATPIEAKATNEQGSRNNTAKKQGKQPGKLTDDIAITDDSIVKADGPAASENKPTGDADTANVRGKETSTAVTDAGSVQSELKLTSKGKPFKSKGQAEKAKANALKSYNKTYDVVEHEGGFALKLTESTNEQAPEAKITQKPTTATQDTVLSEQQKEKSQEAAARKKPGTEKSILDYSKKAYVDRQIKQQTKGIKTEPKKKEIINQINEDYDDAFLKAEASLPFDRFRERSLKISPKESESATRQAYDALREEFEITDDVESKPSQENIVDEKQTTRPTNTKTAPVVAKPGKDDSKVLDAKAEKEEIKWIDKGQNSKGDAVQELSGGSKRRRINRTAGHSLAEKDTNNRENNPDFLTVEENKKPKHTQEEYDELTKDMERANKKVKQEQKDKLKPFNETKNKIGVNADGREIFEDGNGVRSYIEDGFQISEPVSIIPGRTGVDADTLNRRDEYLTEDELKEKGKIAEKEKVPQEENTPQASNIDNAVEKKEISQNEFAENKIFTADKVAEARDRLKSKLGRLNSGFDPELAMDGLIIAGAYVESGVREFGAFSKAVITDIGEGAKPFLRSWYESVRHYPELDNKGMTDQDAIELMTKYDVYAGDKFTYQGGEKEVLWVSDNSIMLTDKTQIHGISNVSNFIKNADKKSRDTETKPAKDLDYGTVESPNKLALSEAFAEKLIQPDFSFSSITQARKFASELLGGKVKPGTPTAKIIDEAVEYGSVQVAREIVSAGNKQGRSANTIYDRLVDLQDRMPKLSVRTSTSVEQQAYSTPLPLAYLASRLAGVSNNSVVYEPSAGHGALLIETKPSNAVANELNEDRAEALKDQGFDASTQDATQFEPKRNIDTVLTNPPFGAVKDENVNTIIFTPDNSNPDYKTGEIDHAISLKALDAMKSDGKAVLILGGVDKLKQGGKRSDSYNAKAKREFYYTLYNKYNVVDHFTVDGDLYAKQGSGWPVDFVVIDGKGKSNRTLPAADVPRQYKTFNELKEVLDGLTNAKNAESSVDTQNQGIDGAIASDSNNQGSEQGGQGVVPGSIVGQDSVPDNAGAKPGQGNAGSASATSDKVRVSKPKDEQSIGNDERQLDGQPSNQTGDTRPDTNGQLASDSNTESSINTDTQTNKSVGVVGKTNKPVEETSGQVAYTPTSKSNGMGTLVPINMKAAVNDALKNLESRVDNIDNYVAKELGYKQGTLSNYFGAEQVDAIALALNSFKDGAGFIIGDQTGIGKGRVVAAMIRYAMQNGKTPVFVTEKPNLYGDMYRDLVDIGMTDIRPIMTNSNEDIWLDDNETVRMKTTSAKHNSLLRKLAQEGDLGNHNIIFTTYNQMQTVKGNRTVRHDFLESINDDAMVVFDESHNAGGTEKQSAREENKMDRAKFARQLAGRAWNVFFSSATYAKRPSVMDLYFRTDMSIAVPNPRELGSTIQAGGVPLQQVVASMLAESGQYIRRERSFAGIEYNTEPVPVSKATYNNFSKLLSDIQQFSESYVAMAADDIKQQVKAEAKMMTADGSTGGAGAESTNFTSIMHNLIDQMLLAAKADFAADKAIAEIRAGRKPVITVANTMGSFIAEYKQDLNLVSGDSIGLSFSDFITRYLTRSREVLIKGPFGRGKERHYISDAELGVAGASEFERIKQSIIDMDFDKTPVSPIDWIHSKIKAVGFKTGEITGRKDTIDYLPNGDQTIEVRQDSIKIRRKTVNDFNTGKIDAVILNQAGSTGLSLHASERFIDQKPRSMIIAQAEKNIDTHMQMLGRVNRTGQISKPVYYQLAADIPAEKRPATVLAKKMASLNANTTANRESSLSAKDVPDLLNEYGDEVVASIIDDDPDINIRLGSPLSMDRNGFNREDAARKVTGRIPLLPLKEQTELYDQIETEFDELITQLDAMGENALEAKSLPLDAKTISKTEIMEKRTGTNSPFGEGVYLEKNNVKRLGKPHKTDKVIADASEFVGSTIPKEQDIESQRMILMRHGQKKVNELIDGAETEFETFKKQELAKTDDEKVQRGIRTKLDGIFSRFQSKMRQVTPGTPILIESMSGNFYGVPIKIEHKGKAKNPVALGAWKATIYLADSSRQITIPLSKIIPSTSELTMSGVRVSHSKMATNDLTVYDAFNSMQSQSREDRYIITGNLLSGFSQFNNQGAIVNYEDNTGKINQGIMMPKSFDAAALTKRKQSDLINAEHVLNNALSNGVSSTDGAININVADGGFYRIEIASSKKVGGKYYLNKAVRDALGKDFVSVGSMMRVSDLSPAKAKNVVQELMDVGATFRAQLDNEPSYSKNKEDKTNSTVQLIKSLLPKSVKHLVDTDKLEVVLNPEDVSEGAYSFTNDDGIEGYYDPTIDKMFIVASQVDANSLNAVVQHELYHRARATDKKLKSQLEKLDKQIQVRFELASKGLGSTFEKAAYKRVIEAKTKPANQIEEFQSYIISGYIKDAKQMGQSLRRWVKDLIASIRAALLRAGIVPKEITPELLNALAKYGTKVSLGKSGREVREAQQGTLAGNNQLALASKAPKFSKGTSKDKESDEIYAKRTVNGKVVYEKGVAPKEETNKTKESALKKAGLKPIKDDRSILKKSKDWVQSTKHNWAVSGKDRLKEGIFDRFHGVYVAERDLLGGLDAEQSGYVSMRLSTGTSSIMYGMLNYGSPEWRDGIISKVEGSEGLLDVFEPIADLQQTFFGWMIGNRAKRLMKEGKERNFTKDEIKELTNIDPKHEQLFKDTRKAFNAYKKDVLDLAQEAGLIDKKSRKMWDKGDYIPFYRVTDGDKTKGPYSKKGFSHQTSGIKQLKGGESPLGDPLENIIRNFTHLVDASLKNHAIRQVANNFEGTGILKEIPRSKYRKALVPMDQFRDLLIQREAEAAMDRDKSLTEDDALFQAEELISLLPEDVMEGYRTMWAIEPPNAPDVIRVMDEGKTYYYQVNDEALLRGLTAVNMESLNWTAMPRFFKRLLTTSVTAEPTFMGRNFIRDALHAWVINEDGFKVGIDSLKGVVKTMNDEGGTIDMMFAGASFMGGYINGTDPKSTASAIRRALVNKGFTKTQQDSYLKTLLLTAEDVWDKYRHFGDQIENANREAVFEAGGVAGKGRAQQAFESKDLMDFSMQGNFILIRALSDVLPFFNARLQGLYKLQRAGAVPLPGTGSQKHVLMRGAMIAGLSIALFIMNKDDERYEELEDWDKDANWHFFLGKGEGGHYRIPKPFEVGLMFGTAPERMVRNMLDKDDAEKTFERFVHMLTDTFAMDPTPQFMKPILETYSNKNSFTQRSIESLSDEGKLPSARYNQFTSDTMRLASKYIGDETGLSPKRLQHLWRGYFGTLGSYLLTASDAAVRAAQGKNIVRTNIEGKDIPFIKAFATSDVPHNTRYKTQFYEMLKEVEQVYRTTNALYKDGDKLASKELEDKNVDKLRVRRKLLNTKKRLTKIRRRIDNHYKNPDLSAKERTVKIKELTRTANEETKSIVELVGDIF